MAYGEIGYIIHDDIQDNTWRIAILKNNYSGSSTEYNANMPVFQLNYVEQATLYDGFMPSELSIYALLPNANLLNDIANSGVGTFIVTLSKNGDTVWTGYIDPAITSWTDSLTPIETELRAICGIGLWERISYLYDGFTDIVQSDNAYLPIKDVANKIAQRFAHNISWAVFGEGGDILSVLTINDKNNRTGTDGDYQLISQKTVAEQLAKRFLARWYQWKGWKLEQAEGTLNEQSFKQYVAGGSGFDFLTHGGSLSVDGNDFADGLRHEFQQPISSSIVTYQHGLNGVLGRIDTDNTTGYTGTFRYTYSSGDKISLNLIAKTKQAQTDPTGLFIDYTIRLNALGQTTLFWDNNTKEWVQSNPSNRLWLLNPSYTPIRIETDDIPENYTSFYIEFSEIYKGNFLNVNANTAITGNTLLNGAVRLTGQSDSSAESKVTQAITDNNAAGTYDHGTLYFSTGIEEFDLSAIRIAGTSNIARLINSPGFATVGPTIDQLTTLTINRFAKNAKRIIRGVLLDSSYEPTYTLQYGGNTYYFIGGSLDGSGYWQGTWHQLEYDNEDITFNNYTQSTTDDTLNQGSDSILGDVLNLAFNRGAQTESESLTTLTADVASGATVSSLTISPISSGDAIAALKSGYKVNLLNVKSGVQQVFTVSSDYVADATTLAVSSATAIAAFPKGSAIILNGESLTSYVIKTAQFYTAGVQAADVQSIASLSGSLSGTVTSVPVSALSYQVTDGQKLRIVDADDANSFDEVEVATDTAAGATSIPIVSTTLSGSYVSGDPVVFTVAQASGLLYILAGQAGISATNASNSAATAGAARDAAVTAKTDAETARDNAEAFADDAEVFKNSASASASASATSAQAALTASTQSQSFASSASASATSASGFASTALTARNEAQTAAGQAQTALSQVSASVDGLDTQVVLKGISNADGTTSMALVQLNTTPTSSNVTIAADDIQVAGQTTFLSSISSAIANGTITSPSAKITRSNNPPSNPALNDIWVETDDGDKPYSYNGSTWVPMYTSINGGNIVTGTVTATQIASNAITADKIVSNAITSVKIAADAITTDKIAANAITTTELSAEAVQAGNISANAITATKIASGAVTAEKIAAGSITADKIAAGTVIAADVTAGSITSVEIADGAVSTTKIAGGAITTEKIAADAITAEKINVTTLNAVTSSTGDLTVSGTVKSSNFLTGQAGYALNQDGSAEFQSVTVKGVLIAGANSDIDWDYVNNVSVTNAQIGDAQITTAKIADLTVTGAKIGNASITTAKIVDAAITTAKITDAAITNAKINDLDATKITAGTLSADRIASGSITADKITATNLQAITTTTGALTVDGALTIGTGGDITISAGNTISQSGISLVQGSGSKVSSDPSVINWGSVSIYGTFQGVGGNTFQVDAGTTFLNSNLSCTGVVDIGNSFSSFQGAYQSSDGSAGLTQTISGFTDLIVKNGLIVGFI